MATMRLLLEGPDIELLLATVSQRYGQHAKIVQTEKIRSGGVMGFFSREMFQITVDISENDPIEHRDSPSRVKEMGEDISMAMRGNITPLFTPRGGKDRTRGEGRGIASLIQAAEERDEAVSGAAGSNRAEATGKLTEQEHHAIVDPIFAHLLERAHALPALSEPAPDEDDAYEQENMADFDDDFSGDDVPDQPDVAPRVVEVAEAERRSARGEAPTLPPAQAIGRSGRPAGRPTPPRPNESVNHAATAPRGSQTQRARSTKKEPSSRQTISPSAVARAFGVPESQARSWLDAAALPPVPDRPAPRPTAVPPLPPVAPPQSGLPKPPHAEAGPGAGSRLRAGRAGFVSPGQGSPRSSEERPDVTTAQDWAAHAAHDVQLELQAPVALSTEELEVANVPHAHEIDFIAAHIPPVQPGPLFMQEPVEQRQVRHDPGAGREYSHRDVDDVGLAPLHPVVSEPAPAAPAPTGKLRQHLESKGFPASMLAHLPQQATLENLLPVLTALPRCEPQWLAPHIPIIVLGSLAQAADVAERLGARAGHRERQVWTIHSPDEAFNIVRDSRSRQLPGLYAVELPHNGSDVRSAAEVVQVIGQAFVVIAVDAGRKHSDVQRTVNALDRHGVPVHAVSVLGARDTCEPATALGLGLPVIEIDGASAEALSWLPLLLKDFGGVEAE